MLHEQELCYKWEMLVMAINCSKYQSGSISALHELV